MFRASQRPAQDQKLCVFVSASFTTFRTSRSDRRENTCLKACRRGSWIRIFCGRCQLDHGGGSDNLSQTFFLCDCSTEASRSQRVSGWARQSSSFDCSALLFTQAAHRLCDWASVQKWADSPSPDERTRRGKALAAHQARGGQCCVQQTVSLSQPTRPERGLQAINDFPKWLPVHFSNAGVKARSALEPLCAIRSSPCFLKSPGGADGATSCCQWGSSGAEEQALRDCRWSGSKSEVLGAQRGRAGRLLEIFSF